MRSCHSRERGNPATSGMGRSVPMRILSPFVVWNERAIRNLVENPLRNPKRRGGGLGQTPSSIRRPPQGTQNAGDPRVGRCPLPVHMPPIVSWNTLRESLSGPPAREGVSLRGEFHLSVFACMMCEGGQVLPWGLGAPFHRSAQSPGKNGMAGPGVLGWQFHRVGCAHRIRRPRTCQDSCL